MTGRINVPDFRDLPMNGTEEDRMRSLIEILSAYIEYFHGGWVRFVSLNEGVLAVEMGGACVGCPLSLTTLHGWVEGTARQFFPELKQVQAVSAASQAG
ncbi:MAG: NifU family protein [Chloroflexi bacterium]|nr:NifU family protein [Chloroflexota bacterium]